jgi:hypothetical protein
MASVTVAVERRRQGRCPGAGPKWQAKAVLRPGRSITVINISSCAALVESDAQLRPGAHAEVQLSSANVRTLVRGRIDRCNVAALDPLTYRGVIVFDQPLVLSP